MMNEKIGTSHIYNQPRIAVIGAGIIGLACVEELIEAGYKNITVYADKITPCTTSDVAAAICDTQKSYCEPENTWYRNNLSKLNQLLSLQVSGVSKIEYLEVYKNKFSNSEITQTNANLPDGIAVKSMKNIFLINTKRCINYLMNRLTHEKITINKEKITFIKELTTQYDIIINCTGLGSKELFNDQSVFPIRGQIVILSKPKNLNYCIAELADNVTYIIPRGDECIIGGTFEINNWDLTPDDKTTNLIIERAQNICPLLKNEKILEVKVGLRPGRDKIRFETEIIDQSMIIHNYGHGGEGYSFAWGCAVAVKNMINKEYNHSND